LYGMADLFIAGQFNGADVITAVSVGSQIMHMITVIIAGLAMGTTVLTARAVGARKERDAGLCAGNSLVVFLLFSVFATAILLVFCSRIVDLMRTPPEAVLETLSYLGICFLGVPFISLYNSASSVFRGAGDSKRPLYFVAASCFVNIILDLVFMGPLALGAKGAAIATVLSQAFSAFLALSVLFVRGRSRACVRILGGDFRVDAKVLKGLLQIGLPVSAQDGFIQVSFLVITIIANSRGLSVAAAVGIVEKIICFLFLVPSSMLSAISALAAQNMGAGLHDRARHTLYWGMVIAASFGAFFALAFQLAALPFMSLFTRDQVVIGLGAQYLRSYVFDCFFAAFHFAFSGFFCAYGYSVLSFIHNIISILLVRIPGAALAAKYYPDTLYPMGWAPALGSLLSSLICLGFYLLLKRNGKFGGLLRKS
ncbi:MAG: MATE family efflux transporter, partial [Treponema sp.]|nr:MATE family efflux transporter [Treponema sp.]